MALKKTDTETKKSDTHDHDPLCVLEDGYTIELGGGRIHVSGKHVPREVFADLEEDESEKFIYVVK